MLLNWGLAPFLSLCYIVTTDWMGLDKEPRTWIQLLSPHTYNTNDLYFNTLPKELKIM